MKITLKISQKIERGGGSHLDEKTSPKINAKNPKFQGIMMDCRNLFAVF